MSRQRMPDEPDTQTDRSKLERSHWAALHSAWPHSHRSPDELRRPLSPQYSLQYSPVNPLAHLQCGLSHFSAMVAPFHQPLHAGDSAVFLFARRDSPDKMNPAAWRRRRPQSKRIGQPSQAMPGAAEEKL